MPQILMNQHRDQHAGEQQQYDTQEYDEQSIRVPRGTMVMPAVHATFLSMTQSPSESRAA
jgi:hypothetical protein